ncbi:hypothetical protein Abr02nite_49330 [Paractinoplanes brasiliensis]|nr:hypothetical protein Abr02nite_49330 [Actinoplanes brasiliensis]
MAAVAYDLYREGLEFELRLVDPEAGAVDDCVIVQPGIAPEVHGYQYKSASGNLTLGSLLAGRKTKGGKPKPSLLVDLLDGWRKLSARYRGHKVVVHLVSPEALSRHDRPYAAALKSTAATETSAPAPQHTAAFAASVLQPILSGVSVRETDQRWKPVLEWIRQQTGMQHDEIEPFLASLHIDAGTAAAMPARPDRLPADQRLDDVAHLAAVLYRRVQDSDPGRAVVLSPVDVAALAGFGYRGRSRHVHRFPVELDRYTPLVSAEESLTAMLDSAQRGYLCVLGPPGSGKSTLIAHATPALADRVITYLAFLPGDAAAAGRASATDFLHDVVVQLERSQLHVRDSLPERDVPELRLRFRDLLTAAGKDFLDTGRRTFLIVDGLDHVARSGVTDPLIAELPEPASVPGGVIILLGSQSLAPVNARIANHARELLVEGISRTIDLTIHRLTSTAVERACRRLSTEFPALMLTNSQVGRVVQLVGGHPLALAYVTNALIDLADEQGAADSSVGAADETIPEAAVDEALDRCVRYSGSVADDYAAYLADVPDRDALYELLGDLARLRSPINMQWVQIWADQSALRGLRRIRHLFRILGPKSWMFFHDSFRQFVIESTSVDVLGDPDPDSNTARHAALADRCATAEEGSRERGEEFFHASQSGQSQRALLLATPQQLRSRFLAGTSPVVLTEDIHVAMRLAAQENDGSSLVGLILIHAELQSREQVLGEVDLTGMWIDAENPDAALAYALPDGALRISTRHALKAAVRLDELGHPAARLLFDAADIRELNALGSHEYWETLQVWAAGTARFRPLSVIQTILRRMSESNVPRRTRNLEHPALDAYVLGDRAVHFAGYAINELLRIGRMANAADLTATLRAALPSTRAAISSEDGHSGNSLVESAYQAVADASLQIAAARVKAGCLEEAFESLRGLSSPAGKDDAEPAILDGANRATRTDAIRLALQIAVRSIGAASPGLPAAGEGGAVESDVEAPKMLSASAFGLANDLLRRAGNLAEITSSDLSATADLSDVLITALIERANHIVSAGQTARLSGDAITVDLLTAAAPALSGLSAGAGADPGAPANRDRRMFGYIEQLNKTITNLAVLNAAAVLGDLSAPTMRGLATRVIGSVPRIPEGLSVRDRTAGTNSALLRILADVAASHSQELLRYVGAAVVEWDQGSLMWGDVPGSSPDDDFGARQRQMLGLHILKLGVRVEWLADAVAGVDREIEQAAGAYERLDLLVTQAAAHLQMGDTTVGQELLGRVMPESFSPYWRKDVQLEVWIQWLVRATHGNPEELLREAEQLAPLIAALTEATDGSAEAAAECLLRSVAEVAPLQAVRLAAWQLAEGSLALAAAHDALVAGLATKLLKAVGDDPRDSAAVQVAKLICAVVAALLGPICPTVPTAALESLRSLVEQMPSTVAAAMTAQLSRAVDVHVPAGVRQHWRDLLVLPATPSSQQDEVDEKGSRKPQRPYPASRDWGVSDYGRFNHLDGSARTSDSVAEEISDLDSALAWRSLQADPGTFSWTPVLRRVIRTADGRQLEQLVRAFSGVYDEANLLVAVADQMLANGDQDGAAIIARAALDKTELAWWDRHHRDGVRRKAWSVLAACEGQNTRDEAMQDLVQLLVSADYWPGNLMLQLDEILTVIAPSIPAETVWAQVRQQLIAMGAGIVTAYNPLLDGPVHAGWWAGQRSSRETKNTPYSASQRSTFDDGQETPSSSIRRALLDLIYLDLDHPAWTVREGACAALSWALTQTGFLAENAGMRAALLLASPSPRPQLASSTLMPETAITNTTRPIALSAEEDRQDDAAVAGDPVREMAARAVAAAGRRDRATLPALAPRNPSWIVEDCLRQASLVQDDVGMPATPLPAVYQLAVPRTSRPPRSLVYEFGPYATRALKLADHAGVDSAILLRRLASLASQAMQHLPDEQALQQAAKGASFRGMVVPPRAQAVRAAFGRIVAELIAAQCFNPNDSEVAAFLHLSDIDLVSQPFVATPPWVPIPRVDDWPREEEWLADTETRLEHYTARLAEVEAEGQGGSPVDPLILNSSLLNIEASVYIESGATIIGADYRFVAGQRGDRRERYLLSTTLGRYEGTSPRSNSDLVLLPEVAPTVEMHHVKDWRLADGADAHSTAGSPTSMVSLVGDPLLVWTTSTILHNNAATWVCLNPGIALANGWRPHPQQPLCWQDSDGAITAATVLWRRSTLNTSYGHEGTIGEGSAVILTAKGKTALEGFAPLVRVHELVRYTTDANDDSPQGEPRVATASVTP